MSGTLSDVVIDAHLTEGRSGDEFVMVKLDAVLGHDATIALLADRFEQRKLTVFDPNRVLFALDHFSPPATADRAAIAQRFRRFAQAQGVSVERDRGICHQLLVESSLCIPGSLIVGADSHTVTGGAVSSCATGMGSTDVLFALATGTTWLRRPATIRVVLKGSPSEHVSGRDIAIALVGLLGEDGAQYRSVELFDDTTDGLSMDDRCAIANLTVEAGAKFGLFVPDEITIEYCLKRDGVAPNWMPKPGLDAKYERTLIMDLGDLRPTVARPWSPANTVPVNAIGSVPITTAFIGSCAGGRESDLELAARLLHGRQVHDDVRLVVIPASRRIHEIALSRGWIETLVRAGAVVCSPSCGPCGGIDKGVLGPTDVCVSTSTRNYRGRMGDWNSQTYLASTRTTVLSALSGRLHSRLHEEAPC
ncbi:MAG: aconitase/3-isopropylmalate dehydratase large subunit family protein [Polyangiaceae bacterium]